MRDPCNGENPQGSFQKNQNRDQPTNPFPKVISARYRFLSLQRWDTSDHGYLIMNLRHRTAVCFAAQHAANWPVSHVTVYSRREACLGIFGEGRIWIWQLPWRVWCREKIGTSACDPLCGISASRP